MLIPPTTVPVDRFRDPLERPPHILCAECAHAVAEIVDFEGNQLTIFGVNVAPQTDDEGGDIDDGDEPVLLRRRPIGGQRRCINDDHDPNHDADGQTAFSCRRRHAEESAEIRPKRIKVQTADEETDSDDGHR